MCKSNWAIAALSALALAPAPLLLTAAPAAANDCQVGVLALAHGEADADEAGAFYAALSASSPPCEERALFCAGQVVALRHVDAAYRLADAGGSAEEVRAELERGQAFGSPWQLLVGIADISLAIGHQSKADAEYQRAAQTYQDVLNVVGEAPVCEQYGQPPLPQADETASIHQRMTEALMLAPRLELVRTRAGGCGGIFLQSVRGFTPTFRPLPINFEFAEAAFTGPGRQAADVLLACVLDENYTRIVLSGHTDPVGGDDYNLDLSQRRLDAVAAFLRAGGYEGELVLEAKGEGEPFVPDDPSVYTEDELHRLDRRVVLLETQK